MEEQLTKINEAVEFILNKYPVARNNDNSLWLLVIKKLGYMAITDGDTLILNLKEFKSYPPFESISRCRRSLQAQGFYQSDKQIQEAREKKRLEFKETFRLENRQ